MEEEKGSLSINSQNLFPIIKRWLYSDKDIFIRELVSNAVDAIQKRKHLISLGEAKEADSPWRVDILLDKANKTITVSDNGIGMSADEVRKYINQIAFSGASEFLEKYKDSQEDPIIGHFGLGFYSAFMVSTLVEIETKSYREEEPAVHWSCDGSSTYEMTDGTRKEVGTDIILHVNEDGEKYLDLYEMRTIASKYCSFMAVEIYLDTVDDRLKREEARKKAAEEAAKAPVDADTSDSAKSDADKDKKDEPAKTQVPEEPRPINDTTPLYLKKPSDCTDEEYKQFYSKTFMDFKEPLFWIHLNMDYPYNLKGILYFPKLGSEFTSADGQVKLYCNQVFVADNVKEIIPEFLLLLKGVIDCPDIPLNVSRSYLQNDAKVKKISEYITRKVADKLNDLYKKERDNYEKYWDDIHPFIKYGCLRDEKFYDRVKDSLIYKSLTQDKFITLSEYLEAAKETHDNKVFYSDDPRQQAQYIALLKGQDMDVLEMKTAIDVPFMSMLESKNQGLSFMRVDADLSQYLKNKDSKEVSEEDRKAAEQLFRMLLDNDKLTIHLENMNNDKVSLMLESQEQARRMQDMMKLYGADSFSKDDLEPATLVLNNNNALIRRILDHPDDASNKDLAKELYDLSRLSHEDLSAEDLTAFLDRSQEMLGKLYQ